MNKTLLSISLSILFFCASLHAQETILVEAEKELVKWEQTTHDLGEIPQGKPISVDFVFTNKTEDVIFIDNVRTTCGCTAPTWSKEPVAPGEKAFIEIEYNAKKEGEFYKPTKVYLSGQKQPISVYVKGKVVPKT